MFEKKIKKKLVLKKKVSLNKGIASTIISKQKETPSLVGKESSKFRTNNPQSTFKPLKTSKKIEFITENKTTTNKTVANKTVANKKTSHLKGKKTLAKLGKHNLREELLKKEEHQKFFLQNKPSKSLTTATNVDIYASVPKEIFITEYVQVSELAQKLNIRSSDIISSLMKMGIMATITQSIDAETTSIIASEYNCKVNVISLYEETLVKTEEDKLEDLVYRSPVVTIMGHVDHGKTSLLDAIRETNVVSQEKGGITQHIGAYQVYLPKGSITFLDTPGHAAFTAMRARGANVTDIVIIVVAADDGIMPQTEEAISHAKASGAPIIIAINKIDKPDANVEKVKKDLMRYELVSEELGGSTSMLGVSALQKINLDTLLDIILTTAELQELKANQSCNPVGTVLEARLDQGRGAVATVLVQNGILKLGQHFLVGLEGGKVRAMTNDLGEKVKLAKPSTPIEIIGISGVPEAGDTLYVLESEREVKSILEKRQELYRQEQAQKRKKVNLDNLSSMIAKDKQTELRVIIKADVRGSIEAIEQSLMELSTDEIHIKVLHSGAGEVAESDVMLAIASAALIICFNSHANASVRKIAEKENIEIRYYNIIYRIVDDLKEALSGMLEPDIEEKVTGEAEVREVFKISSLGTIAGTMVKSGFIKRSSSVRLIRDGAVIYTGKLKTLKRFKEDITQVKEGLECGIHIENYNDIKVGDIIECFEIIQHQRKVDSILKKNDS